MVTQLGERARAAQAKLALLEKGIKDKALLEIADVIGKNVSSLVQANTRDVEKAIQEGLNKALIDRLMLNAERIMAMAKSVNQIGQLEDPTGEVLRAWTGHNGLKIKQIRVPLGVIGMIYEARPNVTVEASALCLKAGNAVILRGGREAFNSNQMLVDMMAQALKKTLVPEDVILFLSPQDRESITLLSRLTGLVDLIMARGSEEMINEISSNATVPVLGHGKGVCHVYIDKAADLDKAVRIAFNAKVQRPGVCNAMETLLVHEFMMWDILPKITSEYFKAGVEIRGDEKVRGLISYAKPATEKDWSTEYLDKIVSIKVVDSLEEAIRHINQYGSRHTDSIITEDKKAADLFEKAVDSSCVMVNASTRLHDGGVFGFGSEIGISTQKLHARGTMGLRELTSTKYIVEGTGQIRE